MQGLDLILRWKVQLVKRGVLGNVMHWGVRGESGGGDEARGSAWGSRWEGNGVCWNMGAMLARRDLLCRVGTKSG
ncbi:unnamed protein product [Sphenostylis stenocarpa]|uniref:Uncharacterized protein n=1 Tax=Sphenostylis stenocarpa TaxID=92480 RepID=A0AA86T753_9FABA|nr:unnamed protein product [Sphenostylis stenocarpa]